MLQESQSKRVQTDEFEYAIENRSGVPTNENIDKEYVMGPTLGAWSWDRSGGTRATPHILRALLQELLDQYNHITYPYTELWIDLN